MSRKANAVKTLYRIGRIDFSGVRQAVKNGLITEDEFAAITGEAYTQSQRDKDGDNTCNLRRERISGVGESGGQCLAVEQTEKSQLRRPGKDPPGQAGDRNDGDDARPDSIPVQMLPQGPVH